MILVRRLVPSFYVATPKKNHPTINRLLISEGAGVDFPAWLESQEQIGKSWEKYGNILETCGKILKQYGKIIETKWEAMRKKKTVKPRQSFLFRQAMFDYGYG